MEESCKLSVNFYEPPKKQLEGSALVGSWSNDWEALRKARRMTKTTTVNERGEM